MRLSGCVGTITFLAWSSDGATVKGLQSLFMCSLSSLVVITNGFKSYLVHTVFGLALLDHRNEIYAFISGANFALKTFYRSVCTLIQIGISQSMLRTSADSIRCGAARMWKLYIKSHFENALLRISMAQAGQSFCRNRLFCAWTFCICSQRGLLWSDNGVDGRGHVLLLYFCVKLLHQWGQVGWEWRGLLNVFQHFWYSGEGLFFPCFFRL